MLDAMPMASLEPSESTMISRSLWRSRPALVCGRPDHAARDDDPQRRDVPAVGLGVEGPQDRLGEGVADDRHRVDALRSTVSSSSTGSKWRPVIVTTLPPTIRLLRALKSPVPCISGAAGRLRGPGLVTRSRGGVEVRFGGQTVAVGGVEGAEQVVLAPHHALGHAGRAAGVEQDEVVAGAPPRRDDRAVGRRTSRQSSYGVAQSGHGPCRRRPTATCGCVAGGGRSSLDALGERAVEDDGDDVGVVPQVDELVGGVAVVGVDGRQPGLERAERRLEVLGRVVEVLGDLVLLGDAGGEQRGGDAVGAPVELGPRRRPPGMTLGQRVRLALRQTPRTGPRSSNRRSCSDATAGPRGTRSVTAAGPPGGGRARPVPGPPGRRRSTATRSTTSPRRRPTRPGRAGSPHPR